MKKYDGNLYSKYSYMKVSIVECFNRTLKEKMWKQFSSQGSLNNKQVEYLTNLMISYNNLHHRTINMKPIDVNHKNSEKLRKLYNLF